MRIPKSFTFALLRDDGMQIPGAHGHGMAVRKEALAWSFGHGLMQQMTRSTLRIRICGETHADFIQSIRKMDHLNAILVRPILCILELRRLDSNNTTSRLL